MKFTTTIHKSVSAFLIVVFALSITPVIVLHSLVANHKDISYADKDQRGSQFSKAGIHCNCMNFVAEAQFLKTFSPVVVTPAKAVAQLKHFYTEIFCTCNYFYTELRGPPARA